MSTCKCKNKAVEEKNISAPPADDPAELKNASTESAPACGCSADCTCGCQEGGECTCNDTACACSCEKEQDTKCDCARDPETARKSCNCAGHGKKRGVRSANTPDDIADDFSHGRQQLGLRGK